MISTTLADRNQALQLVPCSSRQARARVAGRKEKPARNWAVLLVFLFSPLMLFFLAAWSLLASLG